MCSPSLTLLPRPALPCPLLPPRRLQKQAAFEAFDFAELRGEVAAVEAAAAAFDSPIAFCHNDLLSGPSPPAPWLAERAWAQG